MFDPAPQALVGDKPAVEETHPSVNGPELLKLADYIEKNPDDTTFYMGDWRYCIAGQYARMTGHEDTIFPGSHAMKGLGIDEVTAAVLFSSAHRWTRAGAAHKLRTLARTGKLD